MGVRVLICDNNRGKVFMGKVEQSKEKDVDKAVELLNGISGIGHYEVKEVSNGIYENLENGSYDANEL